MENKNREIKEERNIKKIFKEIYIDDFEDPSENFTDSLYDLIPSNLVENELKKIKGVKYKHGRFFLVEKIKKNK